MRSTSLLLLIALVLSFALACEGPKESSKPELVDDPKSEAGKMMKGAKDARKTLEDRGKAMEDKTKPGE